MILAQEVLTERNKAICEAMQKGAEISDSGDLSLKVENNAQLLEPIELPGQDYIQQFTFRDYILDLCIMLGYMTGDTTYDFDNHTSELKFPLGNGVIGGNLSLGYGNFSVNSEAWVPFTNHVREKMTDKDWALGILISSTDSNTDADALIWDANLRYDFFNKSLFSDEENLALQESDFLKIGVLLGYKYERFDFDMSDLYYEVDLLGGNQGQTLYQGDTVLTYHIKYNLPYIGLAADVLRESYGVRVNLKYSFYPTAEDEDNHLLRGLTFYGDYDDGSAVIGSMQGFWKINQGWELRAGLDGTLISIDGRTWEESHDPSWDRDQDTDSLQGILWLGLSYKF